MKYVNTNVRVTLYCDRELEDYIICLYFFNN